MRVSFEWLKDYVDIDVSPEELAEKLTMAGLSVEGLEYVGDDIDKVVVGVIRELKQHPNADKLLVAEVEVGEGKKLTLISGAPNQKEGAKVAVALPGAVLPGGVKIEEVEFRGITSQGMLCSEEELGLADHSAGIMILPSDAPLGQDIRDYLGLRDVILEVELTANRPDCYSMLGVAREVAAILGKKVKYPAIDYPEEDKATTDVLKVEVVDEDLCPRYMAKVLTDVTVGESPLWLKKRLIAAGMRPINNVVDITNYVLLEQNQPLHAFDYDKLTGGSLIIRRADSGEELMTLDDQNRSLNDEMLVIADTKKPVCLAGVMGGANSEVDQNTRTIALESAWFNPVSIRRTGRNLGLRSEASARFERGINPANVPVALDRAAQLMVELCGAKALKGAVDIYSNPEPEVVIDLDLDYVNGLLGTDLSAERVEEVLTVLPEFELTPQGAGKWRVKVPAYRRDISVQADLVEEVARLIGYDSIPATLPAAPEVVGLLSPAQQKVEKIRDVLVGAGLSEISTYSLDNERRYRRLNLDELLENKVDLVVPLSEDHRFMRTSLLPSILETLSFNYNRGHRDLSLFELGRTYVFQDDEELPVQDQHLALALMGRRDEESWYSQGREVDFYDLKGLVELVFEELGLTGVRYEPGGDTAPYHPGRNAAVYWQDQLVGRFGELHPEIAKDFDFAVPVLVGELNVEKLVQAQKPAVSFRPLPKFPASRKDIAVVVSEEVPAAAVQDKIRELAGEFLEDLKLFDYFTGPQIGEGKKSLAFSMLIRHPGRTLTDQEIASVIGRVAEGLKTSLGAVLRG